MVRKYLFIFILLTLPFFLPSRILAETIDDFSQTTKINQDGTIHIVESIKYDFETSYRHGIYRNIPYVTKNSEGKKYAMTLSNLRVTDENGKSYEYKKTNENGVYTLRIGDPDRTITGKHAYIIAYDVSGALTYFSDHDELYWNVTGNEWTVPMGKVSSIVTLPDTISANEIKTVCYTGYTGSTASDCTGKVLGHTTSFVTTGELPISSGLTVAVSFPKEKVAVLEPKEVIDFWETPIGKIVKTILVITALIFGFFWYILYPIKIIWKWTQNGRDPKAPMGVASAWFDPPKTASKRKLTPGETGTLVDESADMQDITATIVDLARRGYLQIIEKKKNDFQLKKVKELTGPDIQPFEETLFNGIFKTSDLVDIKQGKWVEVVADTKKDLYEAVVTEKFFATNPEKTRTFYTVMSILGLTTGNLFLFVVAIIFGRAMPKKTMDGAQAANIGKSLKNFLTSQERQLEFQAKNQMFFEKLLPFAVAFGVEKIWAERFKDIQMKPSDWYQGYDNTHFSSYYLVHSLNSSFNKIQSAATPVSSSTGHSSGFSGGSSGGGGGGGGGGSW